MNYLGQLDHVISDSIFKQVHAFFDEEINGWTPIAYKLDINGAVTSGKLTFNWAYDCRYYTKEAVENLALGFIHQLKEIGKGQQSVHAVGDFHPKNQEALQEVLGKDDTVDEIYPLSPMQLNILFHNIMSARTGENSQQLYWDFKGDFDADCFVRSWEEVVKRHSILRTTFHWRGLKEPLQVSYTKMEIPFYLFDWSQRSVHNLRDEIKVLIKSEKEKGFNMSQLPLMRLYLIKTSNESYSFIWSYWSSLFDNWSWSIILKEVAACYSAFKKKRQVLLENPVPYVQFIRWLKKQNENDAEAFWKNELEQLRSCPPLSRVTGVKSFSNHLESVRESSLHFTEYETDQLGVFAKKHRLTISTIIQGIWALFLSKHTDEKDVLYCVLTSGRPADLQGVENMVGLFVNIVPVRVCISRDMTLKDWLTELQRKLVEIRQYEHVSTRQLSTWCNVPSKTLQDAIHERTLVFVTHPELGDTDEYSSLNMGIDNYKNTIHFNVPLRIYVTPFSSLLITLKYNQEVYGDELISDILKYFEVAIRNIEDWSFKNLNELSGGGDIRETKARGSKRL